MATPITQRKDFKWLLAGGWILANHAGYLNVVCLMDHQAVGHTTGLMGNSALQIANQQYVDGIYNIFVVLCFMVGCCITGLFTGCGKFHLDSRFGIIIIVEAILILSSFGIVHSSATEFNKWAFPLVAIASGMQNAMCTTFSGAVIRTTHTTGTSTDIGIVIGQWLRDITYRRAIGKKAKCKDLWKLKILVPLWFGYLTGAFIGAFAFQVIGFSSLIAPGLTLGSTGAAYLIWKTFKKAKENEIARKVRDKIDPSAYQYSGETPLDEIGSKSDPAVAMEQGHSA
eukprot:TRINITY_DN10196_c0_g1_i1.p1 TRINITY_DN10196_c0_g1~~TRINITY_DN10196_c0_g1_i1.p1  ORF type:complete len:284 (-),score=51.95 TRINITY_DN10196_c0_g1_i1:52-903(-)